MSPLHVGSTDGELFASCVWEEDVLHVRKKSNYSINTCHYDEPNSTKRKGLF